MPPPIIRYGLDPTAVNPDNLVMNEQHVLANRRIRAISPVEGAFYGENVVVRENSSGRTLTKGIHYVPQEYYRTPSELYGKAVYGILLIIDPAVTSHITINYQVVGGIYSGTTDTLKHLLEQVRDDGTEFSFYDVVGRPDAYAPTPHFHSLDNGMKFEYVVHALERIRNAILWSDSPAYNDIYEYIQRLLNEIDARLKHQMDSFITPLLYEFKKNFTKATIGLGNVENLKTATKEEGSKAGTPTARINDFLERKYIALEALVAFKDKLYEHLVSKEKTNIGRTQATFMPPKKRTLFDMPNGAIVSFVSKREAIALPEGFDPNVYPEGLNDDTRITIVKITNNRNNGGGIFLSYFNDGKQAYIGHSSTGTIAEDIVWKKFLFTEDIKEFTDVLSAHIKNTHNPHRTNKAQVGLSEVENLPVITREEILCLKSVRKYMTFDAFLLFMKAFMIGKNGSAADPGDESGEPLDNCQIIYCPCSPCGCGEGGGTTPTPEPCPAYGTLKSTFCEGFTKYGIYHNGTCGTYNLLIGTNSVECGYVAPTNVPAGTELNQFCKGKDRWAKYADGNGGMYENVIEVNSPTCGYVEVTCEPRGVKKDQYCVGTVLWGKFSDGNCGTYNSVIETNSEECGYVTPTNEPPDKFIREYCQGFDQYGVYTNGSGGTYNKLIMKNSAVCGYSTPAPTQPQSLSIYLLFTPGQLPVGQTASTARVTCRNLSPGGNYRVWIKFKPSHLSSYIPYWNDASFTASGSTHEFDFPVNNYGDIPPGKADFIAYIEDKNNTSKRAESPVIPFTYLGEKTIVLAVEGRTNGMDIVAGSSINTTVTFSNFPTNNVISWKTYLYNSPSADGQPVTTDGMGQAIIASSGTIVDASYRGQQAWKVVATYAIGAWAGGGTRTVESNTFTINWTGTGSTNVPAGTEQGRACQGSTLVITYANGSGGSYQTTYANHPDCVVAQPVVCGITQHWTANIVGEIVETVQTGYGGWDGQDTFITTVWKKVTGKFGSPIDGTRTQFFAVSCNRDEQWLNPLIAMCSGTNTDLNSIPGLHGNVKFSPFGNVYGGTRNNNPELNRSLGWHVAYKTGLIDPSLQSPYAIARGLLIDTEGNYYIEVAAGNGTSNDGGANMGDDGGVGMGGPF